MLRRLGAEWENENESECRNPREGEGLRPESLTTENLRRDVIGGKREDTVPLADQSLRLG